MDWRDEKLSMWYEYPPYEERTMRRQVVAALERHGADYTSIESAEDLVEAPCPYDVARKRAAVYNRARYVPRPPKERGGVAFHPASAPMRERDYVLYPSMRRK